MFKTPPPLVIKKENEGTSQQNEPNTQSFESLFSPHLGNQGEMQGELQANQHHNLGNSYMTNMNQNLAPIQNQTFIPDQPFSYLSNNYPPRGDFAEMDSLNYAKRFRSGENTMDSMGYNQSIVQGLHPNQIMDQQNHGLVQPQMEQNNQLFHQPQTLKQNVNRNHSIDLNRNHLNNTHDHSQSGLVSQEQIQMQNQLLESNLIPNQAIKSNPSILNFRHPTPQLNLNLNQSDSQPQLSMSELVNNGKWTSSSLQTQSSWNGPPTYSPQGWDQSSGYGSECNKIHSENNFYSQPQSHSGSGSGSYYSSEALSFPIMSSSIPNFVYNNNSSMDSSLLKTLMINRDNQNNPNELSHVLPPVIPGSCRYSPSTGGSNSNSKSNSISVSAPQEKPNPVCSTHRIRVPSHLLLTEEQKTCMEEVPVVKRVFNNEEPELSRQFLALNQLLPEQLSQPLNKWKTRNTRKRKHAVTHLYQCCCGSDVKQFHGTKGTRRSKQKFPFVGCLAFVEVARRSEDQALIWARGLLDHSPECVKSQPFVSQ